MAAILNTSMGKVTYNEDCLAKIAGLRAMECYGLVGIVK